MKAETLVCRTLTPKYCSHLYIVNGIFYSPRRQTLPPPKFNHCCNPYQHCGGKVKLTFAAKNLELAVSLAVRMLKKVTAKDRLAKSRARQTRKQACSLSRASPYV